MDRLSSCYFCGGALDASLAEYPVVPKELQSADDEGSTVVLCSTCRRKLGAVVEQVVAAAQDDPAADDATTTRPADPADSASKNGAEPGDASDLLDDGADDGTTTTGDASDLFDDGADEGTTTTADEWESPATDDSDDGASAGDSPDRGTDSTGAASETSDDEPTLTKLEYNKVMRLLQNRPFPVDRGEIREVATSAYDIDPAEFDAVVEAAVERDLIAVRNGQFVEPN